MTAIHAELPTREAAQQFADQTQRLPDLEAFFDQLEAAGCSIGIEGRLRAWTMLSRLVGLGVQIADPAALARHLLPVLATSSLEQEDLQSLLDQWLAANSAKRSKAADAAASKLLVIPKQVRHLQRTERTIGVFAVGLIAAAVIALLSLIAFRLFWGASTTFIGAATEVVTQSQPVVSLGSGLQPFWKAVLEDVLSRLGVALVVLVVGLSFAAWHRDVKGRLVRKVGETNLVDVFGLKAPFPKWFRSNDGRIAFDRLKRIRWITTHFIDVPGTVIKTVRAGGQPVVVLKRQRELPNYVLLVDRAAHEDHAGLFARVLEAALIDANIVYSRYDYSSTINRLNPVRGGAKKDVVDQELLPFSVIATRHSGERLIAVGSGTDFFETPGRRRDRGGRRTAVRPGTVYPELIHLREFSAKFLVTSAPVDTWGENERRLREIGMSIFPADVEGIEGLADELVREADAVGPAIGGASPPESKFLDRLAHNSMRLTSDIPPRREEILNLVADLKVWAGDREIYTLIAAIAAFPKIDAGFTLVLARFVLRSRNGEVDSSLFGRLVRLPWIRDGYMPDWLRIAIINSLRRDQRELIREVQLFLLAQAESLQDAPGEPDLDQLVATFKVARELSASRLAAISSRIPDSSLLSPDERIFFSVLRGETLDPELDVLQPEAPAVIQSRMEAPERKRRARWRAAFIGLAALAALLQPWIWMALVWGGNEAGAVSAQINRMVFGGGRPPAFAWWFAVGLSLFALSVWAYTVMRADAEARFQSETKIRLRMTALIPLLFAIPTLFTPAPYSVPAVASDYVTCLAALSVAAWIWLATPERWWNRPSADDMVDRQLQRDGLTTSLGAFAIAAIWGIPWFMGVGPLLAEGRSLAEVMLAVAIGVAAWLVSNALTRRWLIGPSSTFDLESVWLDAAFAFVVALCLAAISPFVQFFGGREVQLAVIIPLAIAAFFVAMRGNLGLQRTSTIWRPVLNGMAAGLLLGFAAFQLIGVLIGFLQSRSLITVAPTIPLLLLCAAFFAGLLAWAVFCRSAINRWYSTRAQSSLSLRSMWVVTSVALLAYFGFASLPVLNSKAFLAPITLLSGLFENWTGYSPSTPATLLLFMLPLPMSLALWPMFRFVGPAAVLAEKRRMLAGTPRQPWWRVVADSPWWGTLAMWIVSLCWKSGDGAFSLWPLALPIAIALAFRHGERATAAIAAGTLPLLAAVAPDGWPSTPGGVWPALAILFWARFVADAAFRKDLLRRETLPWAEAILIVLLLAITAKSTNVQAGETVTIVSDPSWMIASVALVVGASRMPAHRLMVALAVGWAVSIAMRGAPVPAITLSIDFKQVFTALLVLYVAIAWRSYAASGVSPRPPDQFPVTDLRTTKWKRYGVELAIILGAVFALFISSDALPTIAGGLAIAGIGGLAVAGMYYDILPPVWWPAPWRYLIEKSPSGLRKFLEFISLSMISCVLFGMAIGLFLAIWLGFRLVWVSEQTVFGEIGAWGFFCCFAAFLLMGVAARLASERREGETWRQTARRLWKPGGELAQRETEIAVMAGKVFVSYRQEDSWAAGQLNNRLAQAFGAKNIFMDHDIPAGFDFVRYLESQLAECEVFLAVIGRNSLSDKNEYQAVEVAAALERNIPVIPVLIDGTHMPRASELPAALKKLVRRNAVEVRHTQFDRDADALVARVLWHNSIVARMTAWWRRLPHHSERAAQRPDGWVGYWSAAYGRLLGRTFARTPPFDATIGDTIASAPRPFHEALDPVRSKAEPVDRKGVLLPWHWSRSATYELLGPFGNLFGILGVAAAALAIAINTLSLPPLFAPF